MALFDILKNRNPKADPLPVESPKAECYICRRSEDEIAALTSALTDEIDAKIQTLQKDLDGKKGEVARHYQAVVDRLAGNDYLDFKIETIKTDIPQFARKIPDLDEIVRKSRSDAETVAAVVERLKALIQEISTDPAYDIAQDRPEVREVCAEIRSLEEERDAIADALAIRTRVLHTAKGGQVTVHLCGICSGLLEGSPEN
jgi:predicted  nucleic acid-binding Zn-ribbon protein